MTHDITFCADKDRCPKAATCRRAHPPVDVEWLSFSNFYEEGQECTAYWPMLGTFGMPTFKESKT